VARITEVGERIGQIVDLKRGILSSRQNCGLSIEKSCPGDQDSNSMVSDSAISLSLSTPTPFLTCSAVAFIARHITLEKGAQTMRIEYRRMSIRCLSDPGIYLHTPTVPQWSDEIEREGEGELRTVNGRRNTH
jgi:hypothetical protein